MAATTAEPAGRARLGLAVIPGGFSRMFWRKKWRKRVIKGGFSTQIRQIFRQCCRKRAVEMAGFRCGARGSGFRQTVRKRGEKEAMACS